METCLLFHLAGLELFCSTPDSAFRLSDSAKLLHTLLFIEGDGGQLTIDGETLNAQTERAYWIGPASVYELEAAMGQALRCYRVRLRVIRSSEELELHSGALFKQSHELLAYPFRRVLHILDRLHTLTGRDHANTTPYRAQLLLQELMVLLHEQNIDSGDPLSAAQAVDRAVKFMQTNYAHPITVKQMAALAEVPAWQFTLIFQELTGRKPLDYITELRIRRSKELLIQESAPLREIARQVGFTDEYYFNRRFRQLTGLSPRRYARLANHHLIRVRDWLGHEVDIPSSPSRIIYHGETFGDLLALGVQPIGGGLQFQQHRKVRDQTRDVCDVGFPLQPDIARELRPDLIIMASSNDRLYRSISQIAPALAFDSYAPLGQRMTQLGEWLGKQQEASQWLERFHSRAESIWRRLPLGTDVTATVFAIHHGRLFVMGATGFSSSLYYPYAFNPPASIKELIQDGSGYAELSPDRPGSLASYAGDYLFLLCSSDEESRVTLGRLSSSTSWLSLPAVRAGRVYQLEADEWNHADALTVESSLELLPTLLHF
ncbi:AraC family transcriptional regulator [Paenibacillus sp. SYP-B4298]|uniref:AraC family transcriptional regulator n=1 Tax=Paenibacillus sp. SYP-B4298 TaxID=2996034 RepID=UPI0022DD3640|nr:AraC family transcriptional regulator [Paenibacillus sp. SYP-B4298]